MPDRKNKRRAERVEKYTPGIACQVGVYVAKTTREKYTLLLQGRCIRFVFVCLHDLNNILLRATKIAIIAFIILYEVLGK